MSNLAELKVLEMPKTKAGSRREYNNPVYKSHTAHPIKDEETMRRLREGIRVDGPYGRRNLAIWDLGLFSGRRCGDILNLRMSEVWDDIRGDIKEWIVYMDRKTSKRDAEGKLHPRWLKFQLTGVGKELLLDYMQYARLISKNGKRLVPLDKLLFEGQYGGPLGVSSYTTIIKRAAERAGINPEHLSSHTMRKTFAMNLFKAGGAEFARMALGHSSLAATDHYIGGDDEYLADGFAMVEIPGVEV